PFTSDLSGQDFWTLLKAGYRPVGMVMGNCVYHVAHQSFGQWFKNIGQNVEMTNFTQALYDARELAMERMQNEAVNLHAEGIVGVDIHEGSYAWSDHIIEFFSVGTAIIAMRADHHIPAPQLVLSVND
ncbi:MAG TPA: heavy metal-binding domain-containing protein, partial [Candidatus Obscuribacter sp.]|nr:heavy metal-binding domain-containing protein [Candidatus Obscuribacter sp.]